MPPERRFDRVARRPCDFADEHALFFQDSVDERRLADIRPPDDGDARLRRWPLLIFRVGGSWQPFDDLVEQIARTFAVFGGNLYDRLEAELIELERAGARPLVVAFVDRQNDRFAGAADGGGNIEIRRDEPLSPIYEKQQNTPPFYTADCL